MSWKEGFSAALLKFVREDLGKADATEVTNFDSTTQERGNCDTCGYTVTVIEITYRTADRGGLMAEWEGDFGELIRRLSDGMPAAE